MRQWLQLQERWMREGNHCWLPASDQAGAAALERHLLKRRIPFASRRTPDDALVYEPASDASGRHAA